MLISKFLQDKEVSPIPLLPINTNPLLPRLSHAGEVK